MLRKRGHVMPKQELEYVQKRIDSVQKLIRSASVELDDIKNELRVPPRKGPVETDTIIIDIRKRLNKANELIKNCYSRSIERDTLIDRHTDLDPITGYYDLVLDT